MKNNFRFRFLTVIVFVLFSSMGMNAQTNSSVDEKLFEGLHGHASLNVVFSIIAIILLGLFITLFRLDRKVSRLEKEINPDNNRLNKN